MRFFRRGETLNERLLREAGLDRPQPQPAPEPEPEPELDPVAQLRESLESAGGFKAAAGLPPRARRWDAVVTAEAPDVRGNEVDFVTLPDGSLLVEREEGNAQLDLLAQAVERELTPPYRAHGVRKTASVWAVSASRIEVARFDAEGEKLELTQTDEGKTFVVDGVRAFGSVPELEKLGEATGDRYAIEAERLDADLWEVRVTPL
jgi:hypothetical protein